MVNTVLNSMGGKLPWRTVSHKQMVACFSRSKAKMCNETSPNDLTDFRVAPDENHCWRMRTTAGGGPWNLFSSNFVNSAAMECLPQSSEVAGSNLNLHVALPSGRCDTVSVLRHGTIGDLKIAAQQSLGQSFLRLAAPDGCLLDLAEPLQLSGLQDGDTIAAIAQQPKLAATKSAFALWCVEADRIVTWGDPQNGGDSSAVRDKFQKVQQVYATAFAFAAILADKTVVTWGRRESGGDSTAVKDRLNNVQQIHGSHNAFAAILADGTVVTWGDPECGGDSTAVQAQLRNVQKIYSTGFAFAAILADENCRDMGRSRLWR